MSMFSFAMFDNNFSSGPTILCELKFLLQSPTSIVFSVIMLRKETFLQGFLLVGAKE